MSIYHFSVNIQSKAIESSPLATLAYQCRTSVYDAVNRKTFSYKGADFVYSGVSLPKNAPEKYRDPITLCTDVLLNESQTNAQLYSYINHINSIFYFAMLNVAVCFAVLLCFCGQLRFDLSKPKAFTFYRRLRLLKRFKSTLDMFHYIILGAEFLATVLLQLFLLYM